MFRLVGSAILGFSLLASVGTVYAQEHHDQDRHDQVQRDHQWNSGENEYWHQYLKEHHKKEHDWQKANKREQSDYWKWRDQHHEH